MKLSKIVMILTFMFTQTILMTAQEQAPIIDREIFFGNAEVSGGQLSPDGKYLSFLKEHDGIMNIWVKTLEEDFENAKLLTASSSPILGYFWTYDGKYILYVNDNNGDENMNIYSVNPIEKADGLVPPSKNLTPMKEVTAQIYMVSKKNPDLLKIGLNDRDKAWHDLYELEISTGKLTKEFENNDRITSWSFDWSEQPRLAYRSDENGFTQVLKVGTDGSFEQIYETNLKESAYVAAWTKDNKKAYFVSNKGDVNLSTLFLLDPENGNLEKVESDPDNKVDFGGIRMNRNTREVLYTTYTLDKTKYYFKDAELEGHYKYLSQKFPDREISFASSTRDYSKYMIVLSGDKFATDVYLYDTKTKALTFQYTPRPSLKEVEKFLAEMRPITYKSSDGLDIPAYLTIPYGADARNLPVVVVVHGGPKGPRDYWGYNSNAQFLANRGYAVLQPNFRASGGYGKKFLNAGDKQWGKLMQDDITYGVKYLINEGIADDEKIAIMGGSYGGYATLAGLAFTPELYTCGVDIVGPSNLFTLLESIPAYWEAGRKWLYEMTGDPETEEGQKLIKEASPLFHADKIVKPLLIIQGANDPRVKKAEAEQIVVAMRDRQKDVQYILATDEGHGFRKPLNRKAMYAEIEQFFAKYLGGRFQATIPKDVEETLEKLRVDINTVKVETPKEMEALQSMPTLNFELKEGTTNYDVVMNMGGNEIKMEMNREITKNNDQWVITETTTTPQGNAVDKITLGKDYNIVSRQVVQGPITIPMEYTNNSVSMNMMGKDIKIEADGLIMLEGATLGTLIGGLDLKEGDAISYYNGDMMTAKAKQMTLTHKGHEKVNDKDYILYEAKALENESEVAKYWINPATGTADKIEMVIPAYNNAVMTFTKK